MGERRKARRYQVSLPLQICTAENRSTEFHTAQLRDISRTGIYFISPVELSNGSGVELTFALPAERDNGVSVLVRASAKALRSAEIQDDVHPVYGVAASIDRVDFVRPVITNAA